jgi:hypothetical protein
VTKPSTTSQRFYAHLAHLIRPYRWDLHWLLATAAASGLAVLLPRFRGGVDSVVQRGHWPAAIIWLAVILLTIGKGCGEYLAYQRIAGMDSALL